MFKRFGGVLVLSIALLFSGVFHSSVAATPQSNQMQNDAYKPIFQMTSKWDQSSLNDLFTEIKQSLTDNEWQVHQPEYSIPEKPASEKPEEEPSEQEEPVPEEPEQEQQATSEQPAEPAPTPSQNTGQDQAPNEGQMDELSEFEQQVVELTNNERTQAGLAPLEADQELSRVARHKSQDMADANYFDHNSPTYGSPFDMMQAYGIHYRTAGENIAQGQRSPQEVVNAWMNSPGHRENIMNSNFTHIGVGFAESGNHWTQMFIGK